MKKVFILLFCCFSILLSELKLPKTRTTLIIVEEDIHNVFDWFSMKTGINIVCTPEVKGTITLNLRNVPLDKIFNSILSIMGLVATPIAPNVIKVSTPRELETRRKQELVYTKIFTLKYVSAEEVKKQLDSIRKVEKRKGTTTIDPETNTIVVTDTLEGLKFAENFIRKIDKRPKQVIIEAKLVDVRYSDILSLGINWTYISDKEAVEKAEKGETLILPQERLGKEISVTGYPLPTSGGSFIVGFVTDKLTFYKQFSALLEKSDTKILATPRVATVNNKEAVIFIGEKLPFKDVTVTPGGAIVEETKFLETGIKLTVTPTINPDGWIFLKVRPEASVPGPRIPGEAPEVSTREAEVNVMVKDGDTIVIGGLLQDTETITEKRIPVLGSIPILGYLFKYKSKEKRKSELLVFLTPKILEE